jgi:Electron transfer DM13
MKKLIIILTVCMFAVSCEVESDLTKDKISNSINPNTSVLKYSGTFIGTAGITVSGQVKIFLEGNLNKVKLENFSIENGPDLKVYLSKTSTANDFVNLGNLTSSTVYEIPTNVNISDYPYVLIHCQQYNHTFAIAQLIQN